MGFERPESLAHRLTTNPAQLAKNNMLLLPITAFSSSYPHNYGRFSLNSAAWICRRLQAVPPNAELLETDFHDVGTHISLMAVPRTNPKYQSNIQAMVNSMLFERQECKTLMERFLKVSAPYTDVFLSRRQNAVLRGWRKVMWLYQKEEVSKLERDL